MTPYLSRRERFIGWLLMKIEHIHVDSPNQRHAHDLMERPDTLRIVSLLQRYYEFKRTKWIQKQRSEYYQRFF